MTEKTKWWKDEKSRSKVLKEIQDTNLYSLLDSANDDNKSKDLVNAFMDLYAKYDYSKIYALTVEYFKIMNINSFYANSRNQYDYLFSKYGFTGVSLKNFQWYAEIVASFAKSLDELGINDEADVIKTWNALKANVLISQNEKNAIADEAAKIFKDNMDINLFNDVRWDQLTNTTALDREFDRM